MNDKEDLKNKILERMKEAPGLDEITDDKVISIAKHYKKAKDDPSPIYVRNEEKSPRPDSFEMSKVLESTLRDLDLSELEDIYQIPLFAFSTFRRLTKREQSYYLTKWVEYSNEYDFARADRASLHALVMEEIVFNRLYEKQLRSNEDCSKQLSESIRRYNMLCQSLGISRSLRIGKSSKEDISKIVKEFDEEKEKRFVEESALKAKEEEELLERKSKELDIEIEEIKKSFISEDGKD